MQPLKPFLLLITATALLAAGCSTRTATRLTTDAIAVGVGALAGDKLSDGNPYVTAAGAVAALGIKRVAEAASDKAHQQELALAYERGRAQNAQATYDAIQNAQREGTNEEYTDGESEEDATEIPITAPERVINGVRVNATTEYISISHP